MVRKDFQFSCASYSIGPAVTYKYTTTTDRKQSLKQRMETVTDLDTVVSQYDTIFVGHE